ncbi:PadR family transcriptional regulator [Cellulomonas sp. ACRRI]|uniref:PadR family transcriptional regulator n=1 Tax=Cellulomonas sp. ACRRI TaxID=2918188 RepID=UPI001EF356B5|nr:PadR family transcriptional regulator [Cellulomonas sp. ACRRI]MCG7287239.1 PadR family transcriptional regulator [Cellulomonas sp. ACRRI]
MGQMSYSPHGVIKKEHHVAGSLTPLAVAVLALLVERPLHPYEMHQVLLHRATDRIVKVRPGSLYHSVDRLHRDGLVRAVGTERAGNRPERTTYEITPAGRDALTEQLAAMIAAPVNEYPRLPLALAEAHNLPRATVLTLLRDRRARLAAELDDLRAGVERVRAKDLPARYWIDLTYQIAVYETESTWIATFIEGIESGDIAW